MDDTGLDNGHALLLMDYQEGICRPDGVIGRSGTGSEAARRGVLDKAAEALQHFRERDWPRIHVRVAFDAEFTRMTNVSPRFAMFRERGWMVDGSPEATICREVQPRPGEPVVDKGCVNPFVGTRLHQLLVAARVDHLVLGGVATHQVVESTARIAADSGYRVTVLEDLCAAATQDLHDFSVTKILPSCGDVTTAATLLDTLEQHRPPRRGA
jgi:nicotinamidase-related amidase